MISCAMCIDLEGKQNCALMGLWRRIHSQLIIRERTAMKKMLTALCLVGSMGGAQAELVGSSGADGSYDSLLDTFPSRASGRYDFTRFSVDANSVLDLAQYTASETIYLLTSGSFVLRGILLATDRTLVLASSESMSLSGSITARTLLVSSDFPIENGGHLNLAAVHIVFGGFDADRNFELLSIDAGSHEPLPSIGNQPVEATFGGNVRYIGNLTGMVFSDFPVSVGGSLSLTASAGGELDVPTISGGVLILSSQDVISGSVFLGGANPVPIPASFWLFSGAIAALGAMRRRLKGNALVSPRERALIQ
jgi:hypothetical protein